MRRQQSTSSIKMKNVKSFYGAIFLIAVVIHLLYYASGHFTGWLNIFFENTTRGQDFFQIPNAAFSFLHGGSLQGELPAGVKPYTSCCAVNRNVYHPFFTLLVGLPLQLFSLWTSFGIWVTVHFIVSLFIVYFLWKRFSNHQFLYLSLSFYLLNSYHYYEIRGAQYHFLLILFTLLMVYELAIDKDNKKAGIYYFFTLLVKPIGLLWVIPLIIYRQFKTLAVGLGLYLLVSLPFILIPQGKYFFNNLWVFARTDAPNYNLIAIKHFLPIPANFFSLMKESLMVFLILYQIFRKPPLFYIIFLWVSFQLLFYSFTFEYHFTILSVFIAIGILLNYFVINSLELLPMLFLTLPTPIIFMRIFLKAPPILTPSQWSFTALWTSFWLLLLDIMIVFNNKIQSE